MCAVLWIRRRTWLLDLGHLNWLLLSGRDNFSGAESLTAVSTHSRLPPPSCPWACRCACLLLSPLPVAFISTSPCTRSPPSRLSLSFPLCPSPPLAHSYMLLGFSSRPVLSLSLSLDGAQTQGSRGDFILLLNPQNAVIRIFSWCDQHLHFLFHFFLLSCYTLPLTRDVSPVYATPLYQVTHRTQSSLSRYQIWPCHF